MWIRSGCRPIVPSRLRVADARRLDGERGAANRDVAVGLRIGRRSGDVDFRLQRAGDLGERGREALNQPEIDRVLSMCRSNRPPGEPRRLRDPPPCACLTEQRQRNVALGGRATWSGSAAACIDGDAASRVLHGAAERVVVELTEAALSMSKLGVRPAARPSFRRQSPTRSGVPVNCGGRSRIASTLASSTLLQRHLQRVARRAERAVGRNLLAAADQREVLRPSPRRSRS